jgi:hypothetical protein
VSRLNGAKPPDPLDDLDEVIAELEGNEWEVISEVHEQNFIFPTRARTTVETDSATGRTKVVSIPDEEVTKADHPRPETVPPRGKFVLAVLNTIQPPWLRVPVVLALIGAVVVLILKGVKVWP